MPIPQATVAPAPQASDPPIVAFRPAGFALPEIVRAIIEEFQGSPLGENIGIGYWFPTETDTGTWELAISQDGVRFFFPLTGTGKQHVTGIPQGLYRFFFYNADLPLSFRQIFYPA